MDEKTVYGLLELLKTAERHCSSADHLVSVTMPVVKDSKLLIKGFESLHKGLTLAISAILRVEEAHKRIRISTDPKENLGIFFEHCAGRYGVSVSEVSIIQEIMFLARKHRESAFEFSKHGKRVILDDESGFFELDGVKFKQYLQITRKVLEKAQDELKGMLERYK